MQSTFRPPQTLSATAPARPWAQPRRPQSAPVWPRTTTRGRRPSPCRGPRSGGRPQQVDRSSFSSQNNTGRYGIV
jgi:hypothetical protein